MHVELFCPECQRRFETCDDTPAGDVFEWISEEGPWRVLGDGETFEDSLAAALADRGADRCPRCGSVATVMEESLGRLTLELLGTW